MRKNNTMENKHVLITGSSRGIGLAIAEILLARDKEASEGKIAPRFNSLVRKETCAAIAESLELGPVIRLGRSEMLSGGRSKQAILGDAMEAILAAVRVATTRDDHAVIQS